MEWTRVRRLLTVLGLTLTLFVYVGCGGSGNETGDGEALDEAVVQELIDMRRTVTMEAAVKPEGGGDASITLKLGNLSAHSFSLDPDVLVYAGASDGESGSEHT